MAVNSETSKVLFEGNNSSANPYDLPFYFFDKTDLKVLVKDSDGIETALEDSGFSVTGEGNEDGGALYTTAPIPATSQVIIYRNLAAVQNVIYEEGDQFPAKSHERALDRLTMLIQQALRSVENSVRLGESDSSISPVDAVPLSVLGLDGDKEPRMMTAAELAVFLNLTQQFFGEGTKTFLSEADRNLATPDFLGQLGVQLDEYSIWVSHDLAAGAWGSAVGAIADQSLVTSMLEDGILSSDSEGRQKMADGFLSADAAGRAKMANKFVTFPKLQDIATQRLLGRSTASTGSVEEITLGSGLALAGGTLSATTGGVLQTKQITKTTWLNLYDALLTYNIPFDNSPPLISEGILINTLDITLASSSSKVRVTANAPMAINTTSSHFTMTVWRGTTFVGMAHEYIGYADLHLDIIDSPGASGTHTYTVRGGVSSGTSAYLNGDSVSGNFVGSSKAILILQELSV